VTTIGAKDKRQITAVPVVSAAGEFIAIQAIFKGKTQKVLAQLPDIPKVYHSIKEKRTQIGEEITMDLCS